MSIYILRSTEIINDSRTFKLYGELIKFGKEARVLGWNRSNKKNIDEENFELFSLKSKYGDGISNLVKFVKFETWLFIQLVKNRKAIDIIHSCDLDTGFVTLMFCKLFKKNYNYDIYDFYVESHHIPKFFKIVVKALEFLVINQAQNTIVCTRDRISQIDGVKQKNLIVIYNTPNLSDINHDFKLKANTNRVKICYVGILQNSRLLLEVLETIHKHQDMELHIGGFGMLESKVVKECYGNVFFYGALSYADALGLEEKCDILFATYNPIIPNHKFSAPNKLYESCALGKSIIVCKNTGIDKVVEANNIGKSIEYDIKQFWYAVSDIIKEKDIHTKNSLQLYSSEYSWKCVSNKIKDLYKQ